MQPFPIVMREIGRRRWAIAEGYIPGWTVRLLNASDRDAHVQITVFFAHREPAPNPSPRRPITPASSSPTCRWSQHTRLDSRQAENALLTTVAYAGAE